MSVVFIRALLLGGLFVGSVVAQAEESRMLMQHPLANVTTAELQKAIKYLVPAERQLAMRSSDKNMRSFLADYFTVKMLAEAAREKNLQASERIAVLTAAYENRQLSEMLIEEHIKGVRRPNFEKLALETYKAKPELFLRPEQVEAEHILIAVNGERGEVAALERAREVYEKVRQKNADFAALAKEYSDDPSAERNFGKLGFFDRAKMVPEFSEAAFALKVGEVSEPIKTAFGYHIIHVTDKRAETMTPFGQVKSRLAKEEEDKFLAKVRQEFIASYNESAEIFFDDDLMVEFVKTMQGGVKP